jgi:predicted RNA-binding protein YlqC (UPF0109 family)
MFRAWILAGTPDAGFCLNRLSFSIALSKEKKMEKDLIEYIAKSLVDDPVSVNVSVIEGEKSTILELRVAADDIGKVIGKHGRIAKAMRTVLQAATAKTGRHTVLEILD